MAGMTPASPLWGDATPGGGISAGGGAGAGPSPWAAAAYNGGGVVEGQARKLLDAEGVLGDVEAAGRLVSDTLARDDHSDGGDLLDVLEVGRIQSQPYSSLPREWPPLVELLGERELPPDMLDRYSGAGGLGTALCGIFPSISRAWATVDNSFFLWPFNKWEGQCKEYSGEEQAISAVGLVRPKSGVFIEAIQHVVVLTTPVEIVLVGVCCSPGTDGRDPYEELELQPLPDYTIPSDGVTMCCVVGTDDGRIFLGGKDGHLYEVLYSTGSGWQKRCRKICHTAGLSTIVSRFLLPSMLRFGAVDPVVEIVIDEERHILYTRTEQSRIQVFDLGKKGDSPPKKVWEDGHVGEIRDFFYGGGSSGTGSGRMSRPHKTQIISISPVSSVESRWIHLVAVATDGRRVFLTTNPNFQASGGSAGSLTEAANRRPSILRTVTTRAPPSHVVGVSGLGYGGGGAGGRGAEGAVIKAEAGYYSSSLFFLSDTPVGSTPRMIVANRDWSAGSTSQSYGGLGGGLGVPRGLKENVSVVPIGGRVLAIADILPPDDVATVVEGCVVGGVGSERISEMTRARRLWAHGELATQHVLPRRRMVIMGSTGIVEVAVNRPIDLLQRLLENGAPRPDLESFFQREGVGETAAMCLLLAARITSDEYEGAIVPSIVAERAAEAFEDPRLVGAPQMRIPGGLPGMNSPGYGLGMGMGGLGMVSAGGGGGGGGAGFNMGQLVQEPEPMFSGAHEGLCLCTARLLRPVWEFPIVVLKGGDGGGGGNTGSGVVTCRLSVDALRALELKIRPLEQFLRTRRNQRRGHYSRVAGFRSNLANGSPALMDVDGIERVVGNGSGGGDADGRWISPTRGGMPLQGGTAYKRQRLVHTPADLVALEVRGMECMRRLLRRSAEALLLLQMLAEHNIGRLAQNLDEATRSQLLQLTFHNLVCSGDGDRIATQLVAALMQYYVTPEGKGCVDEMSRRLWDGCPSFYSEADHTFYQAVESLERAVATTDAGERERLARDSLRLLSRVPESADLLSVCKRFEDIRFYEAVVELPLRKAHALDPNDNALNERVDDAKRQAAIDARNRCYAIVTNALRALMQAGIGGGKPEFASPSKSRTVASPLDDASREHFRRHVIQLSMKWNDRLFHERLYQTMIELGMERELLELSAPDVEGFLRSAGNYGSISSRGGPRNGVIQGPVTVTGRQPVTAEQVRYLELLAKYYVHRRYHNLAAHVFLRLAERRQAEGGPDKPGGVTLDQRCNYMSSAVLEAKSQRRGVGAPASDSETDSQLLELLQDKLSVLRFQMRIKEDLERIGARIDTGADGEPGRSGSSGGRYIGEDVAEIEAFSREAREKAQELGYELKTITSLYNDYAVPFELWELCLEMLAFSNYSGDAADAVVKDTWTKLITQSIEVGGMAEACESVKRVGSKVYPRDGGSVPLEFICIQLEKAAQERVAGRQEDVGDEDIARALMQACNSSPEPVQRAYDRLLSRSGGLLQSPALRLRLLRSVLCVTREWVSTLHMYNGSDRSRGTGLGFGAGGGTPDSGPVAQRSLRGNLSSACNRYMAEVRRLAVPPSEAENVIRGFRELEELLSFSDKLGGRESRETFGQGRFGGYLLGPEDHLAGRNGRPVSIGDWRWRRGVGE